MKNCMSFPKRFLFAWLFLISIVRLSAQEGGYLPDSLSHEAKMSIVLASPVDDEVYTVYGHAAFRVSDPIQRLDVTFNYGIFSFDDGFVWRFVKGETDYQVMPIPTASYMNEYLMRGSRVKELVLNLSESERKKVWQYLLWNIRPENKVYRYNFFYDNCSTRPIDIYLQAVGAREIHFAASADKTTWRDLINHAERNQPWLCLGTDLALGVPTDKVVSLQEQLFLPERVIALLPDATVSVNGVERKIVSRVVDYPAVSKSASQRTGIPPMSVYLSLFIITLIDVCRRKISKFWDVLLFLVAGLAGCILFFLAVISVHPHTAPNLNLIVFHPLHLFVGVPCVWMGGKWGLRYHGLNAIVQLLFLSAAAFLPQHFHVAVIVTSLTLLILSVGRIYQQRKHPRLLFTRK